jgi:hypothetical protein
MKSELHLIIIWSHAADSKNKIIDDLCLHFTLIDVYRITWSYNKFSENLSRFYGENLPKNSHKEKHCGTGTFTCIIVRDESPIYDIRPTSKGNKVVNTNLFDSKQLYRSWTGGGHKIHATDNVEESKLQLFLLVNLKYADISLTSKWNGEDHKYSDDIVGSHGWSSFESLFAALNHSTNYVILRNFENIEDELNVLHPDVDLLVENKIHAANILNAKLTYKKKYRVQYNVLVEGKNINFDLRSVGDNYYCSKWCYQILKTKEKENYYYRPNELNYFYSLLYHALLHKPFISKDYVERLSVMPSDVNVNKLFFVEHKSLSVLIDYMDSCNYSPSEPEDISVFWNSKFLSKITRNKITARRFLFYAYKDIKKKYKNKAINTLYRIRNILK